MFWRKKPVLSIYITHGAPLVIKSVSKTVPQLPSDVNILVSCSIANNVCSYKAESSSLPGLTTGVVAREYLFDFFDSLKNQYQMRLYCDGNLGHVGAEYVSGEFVCFVERIKPSLLIVFSEIDACLLDAQCYLIGGQTMQGYRRPNRQISGAACDRAHLKDTITAQLLSPTGYSSRRWCSCFFSERPSYHDASSSTENPLSRRF